MSDRPTNIRVSAGSDINIDNQSDGPLRILVVRSDTGDAGYRDLPAGSRVRDAIGDASDQEIRRNGHAAEMDDELQDGDKVTATPANPEGN